MIGLSTTSAASFTGNRPERFQARNQFANIYIYNRYVYIRPKFNNCMYLSNCIDRRLCFLIWVGCGAILRRFQTQCCQAWKRFMHRPERFQTKIYILLCIYIYLYIHRLVFKSDRSLIIGGFRQPWCQIMFQIGRAWERFFKDSFKPEKLQAWNQNAYTII